MDGARFAPGGCCGPARPRPGPQGLPPPPGAPQPPITQDQRRLRPAVQWHEPRGGVPARPRQPRQPRPPHFAAGQVRYPTTVPDGAARSRSHACLAVAHAHGKLNEITGHKYLRISSRLPFGKLFEAGHID
jgi:hypothetical protein